MFLNRRMTKKFSKFVPQSGPLFVVKDKGS